MAKKTTAKAAAQTVDLGITDAASTSLALTQPSAPIASLAAVAAQFGVATDDLGELARIGADSINRAMFEITRAGMAFLRAQEVLSLGDFGTRDSARLRNSVNEESTVSGNPETSGFVAWIEGSGLSMPRVYEAMRIARFVARLPQDKLNGVLQLGKSKVMLLASVPQEVIDQASESGADLLEKADVMTLAELKAEIKTLQRREANYEAELERAGLQVKRLSEAKARTTDFLLRTEELRGECMALQLGGELHLNSLRKLFDATEIKAPEGDLQAEHIWIVANALAARALDLVDYLKARCPEGMPDRPLARHLLTGAEAERWLLDYPLIENRHAAMAAVREGQREAARPKGPGRPKGSGTGAAGAKVKG